MKKFVVCDNAGNILRAGVCPDVDFPNQPKAGEHVVEGTGRDNTHKVDMDTMTIEPL